MIAIIDYDAGNIRSVEKAFNFLGHETVVTRDRDILLSADKVILPGVGSFGPLAYILARAEVYNRQCRNDCRGGLLPLPARRNSNPRPRPYRPLRGDGVV